MKSVIINGLLKNVNKRQLRRTKFLKKSFYTLLNPSLVNTFPKELVDRHRVLWHVSTFLNLPMNCVGVLKHFDLDRCSQVKLWLLINNIAKLKETHVSQRN